MHELHTTLADAGTAAGILILAGALLATLEGVARLFLHIVRDR